MAREKERDGDDNFHREGWARRNNGQKGIGLGKRASPAHAGVPSAG